MRALVKDWDPFEDWRGRSLLLSFVGAMHALAYFQFRQQRVVSLPLHWNGQLLFLLALSLGLAGFLSLTRERFHVWLILLGRAVLLLGMGLPMGPFLWFEGTLLASLIVESSFYTGLFGGLIYSLTLIIVTILFQRSFMAWDVHLSAPASHDLFQFALMACLISGLVFLLRYLWEALSSLRQRNQALYEAGHRLAQANLRLQEFAAVASQEATIKERQRLARELHDSTAYTLANLLMMLEASLDLAGGELSTLLRHLERTRDQAKEGLVSIRQVLQDLRTDQDKEMAGIKGVQRLVEAYRQATQIEATVHVSGELPESMGEEVDQAIYRLVQEGLTNALRHGRATRVMVSFARVKKGVRVQIKDNGIGAGEVKEGYGLTGMRERIERLGGQLKTLSEPGAGFLLSAWIPWDEM